MNRVYIISRSAHDFSDAERFGELVFLSDGPMNRYSCNNMCRVFATHLRHSSPDDYLLLTGLSVMNSIACALFAALHQRLNLLLYKQGKYIERNLDLRFMEGGEEDGGDHGQDTGGH